MNTSRVEAITDAVLAIIITLMVLEIDIPAIELQNLSRILQLIGIYAVSFIYIAIIWINHHHIFTGVKNVPIQIVWFNFVLLFFCTLIPLATGHLNAHFYHLENHVFFGAILALVSLFYTLLEQKVMRLKSNSNQKQINTTNWASFGMFLLSLPLSYLSVYLSGAIFVLIPLMYFLISQRDRYKINP